MSHKFFQFHDPYILFLLLFLPLLYRLCRRPGARASIGFSSTKLVSGLGPSRKEVFSVLVPLFRILALVFLVTALARPQWGGSTTEILGEGIDILLTIDTSGSMKALDFHLQNSEANRLDVVKKVVGDFISRRTHDRIGMVIFGEEAYTQCPLTTDTDALQMFLKWIRIGIAGDGTAIGNALATSVKRLKDRPAKSKVIILLTDGRNNSGHISPQMAAQIAREFGIKVYAIGVGSDKPVPYPEETPFGTRKVYAKLELDEEVLGEIADVTGGRYFRATQTGELEKIYETIDKLEKSEIKIKEYREYNELYHFFLVAGFVFFLLEILLSRTVFLRIP